MNNRLKEIRKELNLTQQELADKANISRATVISIENQESPVKSDTIANIVKATGVPANRIFFDFDVV
jgi:transcriptional regulator, XRE family|nr:MAG TPA: helix-turn-helix domain protein [Caudoviricetes sp.]